MAKDKFWQGHRVNQDPPKKPGQRQRERELHEAKNVSEDDDFSGLKKPGITDVFRARRGVQQAERALDRQERVAADEPAVEGGDRPSTIRARAKVKNRGY